MKLLFVSTAYPKEIYNSLFDETEGLLSIPMNVFQWSLIEGLEGIGIDYNIVSLPSLPAWPRYKHLYTPSGKMKVNGYDRGDYIRYCDLPAIKQLSEFHVLNQYVNNWCKNNENEDRLYILLFTQQAEKLRAVLKLKNKYKNLRVAVIVTDLIENAKYYDSNKSSLKKIQLGIEKYQEHHLFSRVDKYILLSQQMEDYIPKAKGHCIVVEGIINHRKNDESIPTKHASDNKILLYTGILEDYAGINQAVDAFKMTTNPNFRFIICGAGPSAEYVKEASLEDNRIIYEGKVPHDDIIQLQQRATVLINPRKPDGGITKYSFPSKTMEYMVSGTPMIGYHLEGIPCEYYKYMLSPNDFSTEALAKCITDSLTKPQKELEEFANDAKVFVLTYKNSVAQVKRIIDFLKN